MNVAWVERPTEVANLLNPAFAGAAMSLAVSGYHKEAKHGMPFELAFLVLPFALHSGTRSRLPRAVSTLMHTWLQENRDFLVDFAGRTQALVPFTRESLIFAHQRNILSIEDDGSILPGDTKLKKVNPFKKTSDEIKDSFGRAEFVGRWFALSGTPVTIYTLLGVRP